MQPVADKALTGDDTQYPAVEAAFQFVLPSYQMLASRFESADSRITTTTTIAATLTLAGPVMGRTVDPALSAGSVWFIAALLIAVAVIVCGLVGRVKGTLTVPNPAIHWRESLWLSQYEFKKDAVYFAGLHFDANAKAVNLKGRITIAMTVLMGLEIACFSAWIARAHVWTIR
jgi:hypothetical protein